MGVREVPAADLPAAMATVNFCCGAGGKDVEAMGQEAPFILPRAPAAPPTALQSCVTACCCLQIKERDLVGEWMLSADAGGELSCFERLCFLQCGPKPRVLSDMQSIPQLRGLMGATLQNGDHATSGSLQTLKWASWDPVKREATLPVFGGRQGFTGTWSEKIVCQWCCLMNLARWGGYTYKFSFDPDYRAATIDIGLNLFAFCCLTCIPASCWIPRGCVTYTMKQAPDSADGSEWLRESSRCGGPFELSYRLQEVITTDGKPTKFYPNMAEVAPEQVMITY